MIVNALLVAVASTAAPAEPAANLASWGAGAALVQSPSEHDDAWAARFLFDDDPSTGWCAKDGEPGPHVAVIELAAPSRIDGVAFDNAGVDTDGSAVRDVRVEIADAAAGPWEPLGEFALADRRDGQAHAVTPRTGRYVRLTMTSNHGHAQWTELMGFALRGQAIAPVAAPSITGAYETELYGTFRLKQDGVTANGCYEHDGGRIENGGFDGRVLRFVWTETNGGDAVAQQGSALMVFRDDGSAFDGYWWNGDAIGRPAGFWNGRRESISPGRCTHWSPDGNDVARALAADGGRARLYGILFDTDSHTLRADSAPTLAALVDALRDNPDWTLDIEGHTDASGDAAKNRALSARRAESVKAHLVAAGVATDRLHASGHGADKPVADNATTAGRSQNRRVEVARR